MTLIQVQFLPGSRSPVHLRSPLAPVYGALRTVEWPPYTLPIFYLSRHPSPAAPEQPIDGALPYKVPPPLPSPLPAPPLPLLPHLLQAWLQTLLQCVQELCALQVAKADHQAQALLKRAVHNICGGIAHTHSLRSSSAKFSRWAGHPSLTFKAALNMQHGG